MISELRILSVRKIASREHILYVGRCSLFSVLNMITAFCFARVTERGSALAFLQLSVNEWSRVLQGASC